MHAYRVDLNLADGIYTIIAEPEEAAPEEEVIAPVADSDPQDSQPPLDQLGKPRSMS